MMFFLYLIVDKFNINQQKVNDNYRTNFPFLGKILKLPQKIPYLGEVSQAIE